MIYAKPFGKYTYTILQIYTEDFHHFDIILSLADQRTSCPCRIHVVVPIESAPEDLVGLGEEWLLYPAILPRLTASANH